MTGALTGPAAWDYAQDVARILSGKQCTTYDIYQLALDHDGDYVVSFCGGGPYWWLPGEHGGGMHQIGQARFGQPSFCWTCFKDEYGDLPNPGLVHHPDVPGEIGQPEYQPLPGPYQVDDRCVACGGGFTYLTQDQMCYAGHDYMCHRLHPGRTTYSYA